MNEYLSRNGSSRPGRGRQVLAWGVHLYTALGLILAAWMAILIYRGDGVSLRNVFALMLLATLIDATDGTLARRIRIKEVLPGFDGRRLDDLVDFLTYACLPLLLIWRAGLLPPGQDYWLLLPLLASAYGFCQVSVKTDDGYFLGFPSYWNLVAFYLYVLQPLPGWLTVVILGSLAILTFIPLRYLYPSQKGRLNQISNVLAAVWIVLVLWILMLLPEQALNPTMPVDRQLRIVVLTSFFFPVYYMGASWVLSLHHWRSGPQRKPRAPQMSKRLSASEPGLGTGGSD